MPLPSDSFAIALRTLRRFATRHGDVAVVLIAQKALDGSAEHQHCAQTLLDEKWGLDDNGPNDEPLRRGTAILLADHIYRVAIVERVTVECIAGDGTKFTVDGESIHRTGRERARRVDPVPAAVKAFFEPVPEGFRRCACGDLVSTSPYGDAHTCAAPNACAACGVPLRRLDDDNLTSMHCGGCMRKEATSRLAADRPSATRAEHEMAEVLRSYRSDLLSWSGRELPLPESLKRASLLARIQKLLEGLPHATTPDGDQQAWAEAYIAVHGPACPSSGQDTKAIVAHIKSREAHYREREKTALAKHVVSKDEFDIEAAVFAARVANIIGCLADDIEGGEPFGETFAADGSSAAGNEQKGKER